MSENGYKAELDSAQDIEENRTAEACLSTTAVFHLMLQETVKCDDETI
jgi:hypothetical protein